MLRVITWNINGGENINPKYLNDNLNNYLDHLDESNSYIANLLVKLDPDFVCLQEVHSIPDFYSQSEVIASQTKLTYCYEMAFDASHHYKQANLKLGNAILSKHPVNIFKNQILPNPNFSSLQTDGQLWQSHRKGLISIKSNINNEHDINIISLHLLPLHRFNIHPNSPAVIPVWNALSKVLAKYKKTSIICGDFNINSPQEYLEQLFLGNSLKSVLFDTPTHKSTYFDHIIYSNDIICKKCRVLKGCSISDHFPCYAEFEWVE